MNMPLAHHDVVSIDLALQKLTSTTCSLLLLALDSPADRSLSKPTIGQYVPSCVASQVAYRCSNIDHDV